MPYRDRFKHYRLRVQPPGGVRELNPKYVNFFPNAITRASPSRTVVVRLWTKKRKEAKQKTLAPGAVRSTAFFRDKPQIVRCSEEMCFARSSRRSPFSLSFSCKMSPSLVPSSPPPPLLHILCYQTVKAVGTCACSSLPVCAQPFPFAFPLHRIGYRCTPLAITFSPLSPGFPIFPFLYSLPSCPCVTLNGFLVLI